MKISPQGVYSYWEDGIRNPRAGPARIVGIEAGEEVLSEQSELRNLTPNPSPNTNQKRGLKPSRLSLS